MARERMEFKTEMRQLMDIIVNSLYSNRDIFLRELISNANDALDKLRFNAITNPELTKDDPNLRIKLSFDKDARTLTVSDNGIGMNKESIVEDLGTIARSGTKAFIEKLQSAEAKDRPELIGQFGVGFYSAFMVADRVEVRSKAAGAESGVLWDSDGQGAFTVEEFAKDTRGTDVVLHLKADIDDYMDEYRLRHLVETFSDFIEHPIVMDVEKPAEEEGKEPTVEEETLNRRSAIWLRAKNDISEDEYNEFYRHISRDFEDPAKVVHYIAEGVMEFRALLYIPKRVPFGFMNPEDKSGVQLYIKRVFIQDNYEHLLPRYMRFVRGVVDASDLPLNVSREMLQDNPMLVKIKNNLADKVIDTLAGMQTDENEKYLEFFKQFGAFIREGVATDFGRRDKLADLLQYQSTTLDADQTTTLKAYVERMPEGQSEIYFLIGEDRARLEHSPYLEAFKAKGYEVLLMTDPVDEWVVQSLPEYDGKKLVAADSSEVDLGVEEDEKREEKVGEYKDVLGLLKEKLEGLKDVTLSSRLKESAAVLVRAEGEMSKHMEAIMRQMQPGQDVGEAKRILELNAEHPAVQHMLKRFNDNADDPAVLDYAQLFYDQALLAEGRAIKDPAGFAKRINELIVKSAG